MVRPSLQFQLLHRLKNFLKATFAKIPLNFWPLVTSPLQHTTRHQPFLYDVNIFWRNVLQRSVDHPSLPSQSALSLCRRRTKCNIDKRSRDEALTSVKRFVSLQHKGFWISQHVRRLNAFLQFFSYVIKEQLTEEATNQVIPGCRKNDSTPRTIFRFPSWGRPLTSTGFKTTQNWFCLRIVFCTVLTISWVLKKSELWGLNVWCELTIPIIG